MAWDKVVPGTRMLALMWKPSELIILEFQGGVFGAIRGLVSSP